MKTFITQDSVHIRSDNKTSKMMRRLLIALIPIIFFSFYKNGLMPFIKGDNSVFEMLYPLIMIINGIATSLFVEMVYAFLILKKKPENIIPHIRESYAIFPGLFLGLLLPIRIPIYLLMLSVVIGTVFGKMIFGGFGKNIFNPALIGYLFLVLVFPTYFSSINYVNNYELDSVTSATPLAILKGVDYVSTYEIVTDKFDGLLNMFIGFRTGSPAEVSGLLILIGFIYMSIFGVIKPKIPLIYIGSVFIMTYIIGLFNNMDIWYPMFHILSGGLLFGAVYMATDPVTSPTTNIGQVFYAIMLAVITVFFRFLTPYSEGVMFSILIVNVIVRFIDFQGGISRFDFRRMMIIIIIPIILGTALVSYIIPLIKVDENVTIDKNFKVVSIEKENGSTNYIVTQKCFYTVKAKVILDSTGRVTNLIVLENKETFYNKVIEADYLKSIIENQDDLGKLDTISGATRTTNGLKQMVNNVIEDYKKNK